MKSTYLVFDTGIKLRTHYRYKSLYSLHTYMIYLRFMYSCTRGNFVSTERERVNNNKEQRPFFYTLYVLISPFSCTEVQSDIFLKVRANINRPLYNPDIVKKIYRFNFQCEKNKHLLCLSS